MVDFLRIVRYSEIEDGMFGIMSYNGNPFSLTLEPNDRGNGRNSCIPPGVYICKRHSGPKYKNTWEITEVPGRTAILFHWGNVEDDSLGCILLGHALFTLYRKKAISSSGNTWKKFMHVSERASELHLTITECF